MIEITNKSMCSGCNACVQICPAHCITQNCDEEGFWYPQVDHAKCIHCGRCNSVCPIETPIMVKHDVQAYACQNIDIKARLDASSGAIFTLLSKAILDKQGVVFGARFDETYQVVHDHTSDYEKSKAFSQSKYVQSAIHDEFIHVQKSLQEGKWVLFSGTPCQVEGLLSFLGCEYERLITVDFICHGVPSPKVWEKYLQERQIHNITSVQHRGKTNGWERFSMEIQGSVNYVKDLEQDEYLRGFLSNLFLRPSCYHCAFKRIERRSDLTIADFWGIRAFHREMDDDKGTSLVLVQSEKGANLFHELQNKMQCYAVDVNLALRDNTSATQSVAENMHRKEFFDRLNQDGVIQQVNKLLPFDKTAYQKKRLRQKLSRLKNQLLK